MSSSGLRFGLNTTHNCLLLLYDAAFLQNLHEDAAENVGVRLTSEFRLEPEPSTSAIVVRGRDFYHGGTLESSFAADSRGSPRMNWLTGMLDASGLPFIIQNVVCRRTE